MRLHRFYLEGFSDALAGAEAFDVPQAELADQLRKVFRLRTGDSLIAFTGDGRDYECLIQGFGDGSVALKAVRSESSRFMPIKDIGRDIWLCAAVVKKDNFEWIAEKATELGASHIVPVMSLRSEKKSLNEDRLKKIVLEASEQSGRGDVPRLHPIVGLEESIRFTRENAHGIQMLAFHTEGEAFELPKDAKGPIAAFVGPEGGWSEEEIALFNKEKIPVVCLGKQVLRAETAAVAILSKLVF